MRRNEGRTPRKTPRQARSRATVDAILEADRNISGVIAALVRSGLASHAVNPTLHRVFAEELPGRWMRDVVALAPDPIQPQLEAWLRELGRPSIDAERVAWMLRAMLRAVIHDAIMERPQDLRSGRLVKELEYLLQSYLENQGGSDDSLATV
jgi:hypothetical protein